MLAGALSFGVHFALWRGNRRELFRNLELRTIIATFVVTMAITMAGLAAYGLYGELTGLTRHGFFQILSAHSGTGFSTVPSAELARWGGLAFGGMALAMALGGMSSSTAGGVKALRVGLTIRAITDEVRAVLLPHGAVVDRTYFQYRPRRLTDGLAATVMSSSLLYVALYLVGAGVGLAYGYPLEAALFESISAGANVGLSVGITGAGMPVGLQVVYLRQMWLGRLEFVAVFAFAGFLWSIVAGR